MNYIKFSIETTSEGVDYLTSYLTDLGVTGFEIEDKSDFCDFVENQTKYWDYIDEKLMKDKGNAPTRLIIYVSDNAAGMEILTNVKSFVENLKSRDLNIDFGSLVIASELSCEEDWANNWKKYYKPIEVGEKILIKPQWEEVENTNGRIVFEINPGLLFGTGTHQTTRLCIAAIEKYVNNKTKLLDLGCGSGILSVIALLLGAPEAVAVDIDKNAIERAYDNAEINKLDISKYKVLSGDILSDESLLDEIGFNCYDVVVANIVADVIISATPVARKQLKNNGIFITSGIISHRKDEVVDCLLKNGFEILDIKNEDDWFLVVAKLNK